MGGNLQALAVSFLDDRRHFRLREVVLDRNLDDVDVVEGILALLPLVLYQGWLSSEIPVA